LQVHDEVDAFGRIGAITDDVSEAIDIGDALAADIGEDRLERSRFPWMSLINALNGVSPANGTAS
jgi:hypothetical protein